MKRTEVPPLGTEHGRTLSDAVDARIKSELHKVNTFSRFVSVIDARKT